MSKIIHVQHPVPVRVVPKGGSRERLVHARHVTPLRLREADPAGFREAAQVKCPDARQRRPLFEHEGRLWLRLNRSKSEVGNAPLAVSQFTAFLAGQQSLDWAREADLYDAFYQTPVLAAKPQGMGGPKVSAYATQGDAFDPAAAREVVHDGTARAVADLAEFLDAEVRIAGGAVFVRSLGPLARPRYPNQGSDYVACLFPRTNWRGYVSRGDRLPAVYAHFAREYAVFREGVIGFSQAEYALPPALEAVDPTLLGDDDVLLYVNHLPHRIQHDIDGFSQRSGRSESLEAAFAHMGALRGLGDRGAIRMAEAEEVLNAGKAALALLFAEEPEAARSAWIRGTTRFIDDIVMPVVHQHGRVDEADLEALAGFGP